nr:hypothetical protein CFP56_31812 [Quercus suber]
MRWTMAENDNWSHPSTTVHLIGRGLPSLFLERDATHDQTLSVPLTYRNLGVYQSETFFSDPDISSRLRFGAGGSRVVLHALDDDEYLFLAVLSSPQQHAVAHTRDVYSPNRIQMVLVVGSHKEQGL